MPQLDFNFYCSQIFWLFVSFGLLFVAMRFWLLPPLAAVMKKREEKIKLILRQADKLSAQAERIQKKYLQYVDEVHQYSARILQTAHDEIAENYAKQEEKLLGVLKQDTQKAERLLKKEQKVLFAKIETISSRFMEIFLNVCCHFETASNRSKKYRKGKQDV